MRLCTRRFSATSMSTVRCSPRGTPSSNVAHARPDRRHPAERRQLLLQHRVVGEGPVLGFGFQEEVERVDRRHVGDEVDRDVEMRDPLGEHHAGQVVALRVLLPVEEMRLRLDLQRVGQDRRAGMRRRAQPDRLRAERRPAGRSGSSCDGSARREAASDRLCCCRGERGAGSFCGGLCNATRAGAQAAARSGLPRGLGAGEFRALTRLIGTVA